MVPSPTRGEGNVNPSYKEKIGQTNQAKPARIVSDEISGAVMREGFYTRSQMPLIDSPADLRAN